MKNKIEDLLFTLKNSPPMKNVFNPWRDVDRRNDIDSSAPEIRTHHLKHYLEARIKQARYLLVGEAIGYQGGHFSGIAMTSERILLGYKREEGINPEHVLPGLEPRRTSRPEIMPKGFSEPTATIVWGTLLKYGLGSKEFVLWNTFPWHPYNQNKGILSNRRPTEAELRHASLPLKRFFELFSGKRVVALGQVAAGTLHSMKLDCYEVRHPANAGAKEFRKQMYELLKEKGR